MQAPFSSLQRTLRLSSTVEFSAVAAQGLQQERGWGGKGGGGGGGGRGGGGGGKGAGWVPLMKAVTPNKCSISYPASISLSKCGPNKGAQFAQERTCSLLAQRCCDGRQGSRYVDTMYTCRQLCSGT